MHKTQNVNLQLIPDISMEPVTFTVSSNWTATGLALFNLYPLLATSEIHPGGLILCCPSQTCLHPRRLGSWGQSAHGLLGPDVAWWFGVAAWWFGDEG